MQQRKHDWIVEFLPVHRVPPVKPISPLISIEPQHHCLITARGSIAGPAGAVPAALGSREVNSVWDAMVFSFPLRDFVSLLHQEQCTRASFSRNSGRFTLFPGTA